VVLGGEEDCVALVVADEHSPDGQGIGFVCGWCQAQVLRERKALLELFGLTRFYPDDWSAYTRHRDSDEPSPASGTRRRSGTSM